MYYFTTYASPVGTITLASDGGSLIGLWNENQKYHGNTIFKDMQEENDLPLFEMTKKWLDEYFAGAKPAVKGLPLAPVGSPFRKKIYDVLSKVPYGQVTTYGEIAKKVGIKSGQAVGGAVGHNPISIIIPCHRVIGADHSLTGYAGGLKTKIKLLELEGVDVTKFSVPRQGTAL